MRFCNSVLALSLTLLSLPSSSSFQATPSANWGKDGIRNQKCMRLASTAARAKPGTAKLDTPWEELGFEFRPTNSHVRITYKNEEWGEPELVKVSTARISLSYLFSETIKKKPSKLIPLNLHTNRRILLTFILEPQHYITVKHALKASKRFVTKMMKFTCSVQMRMQRECKVVVVES